LNQVTDDLSELVNFVPEDCLVNKRLPHSDGLVPVFEYIVLVS